MTLRLGALIVAVLLLNACASSRGMHDGGWKIPQPPVATVPTAPTMPPQPLPNTPSPIPVPLESSPTTAPQNFPRTAEAVSGQAVVSLMRQSNDARASGQLDLAASQLERAQRIEPRNYFVWSALARVYLEQQQYDQAISVAGKSTSLARGNLYVEVENWKTIARAREAQGDSLGAVQAQSRIGEIERTLGGG